VTDEDTFSPDQIRRDHDRDHTTTFRVDRRAKPSKPEVRSDALSALDDIQFTIDEGTRDALVAKARAYEDSNWNPGHVPSAIDLELMKRETLRIDGGKDHPRADEAPIIRSGLFAGAVRRERLKLQQQAAHAARTQATDEQVRADAAERVLVAQRAEVEDLQVQAANATRNLRIVGLKQQRQSLLADWSRAYARDDDRARARIEPQVDRIHAELESLGEVLTEKTNTRLIHPGGSTFLVTPKTKGSK
jgi:hypothetical protein